MPKNILGAGTLLENIYMARWHHAKCFADNRESLEYFASAEHLAGLKTLSKDDQVSSSTESN
jgi:hypothetical protein